MKSVPGTDFSLPKRSIRMCILAISSKPSRSRIGADMRPAWVMRTGVPRAEASSQRARTSAR